MKLNKTILTATLLMVGAYTGVVSAHNQTGSLGKATTGVVATDIYQVTCYDDGSGAPAQLFYQVADLAPVLAPTVSIQATKAPLSGTISTDPIDGDALFSPGITFKPTAAVGGAGYYNLIVTKSQSSPIVNGVELYNAQFHCQTATGVHTGTSWIMTQNQ